MSEEQPPAWVDDQMKAAAEEMVEKVVPALAARFSGRIANARIVETDEYEKIFSKMIDEVLEGLSDAEGNYGHCIHLHDGAAEPMFTFYGARPFILLCQKCFPTIMEMRRTIMVHCDLCQGFPSLHATVIGQEFLGVVVSLCHECKERMVELELGPPDSTE